MSSPIHDTDDIRVDVPSSPHAALLRRREKIPNWLRSRYGVQVDDLQSAQTSDELVSALKAWARHLAASPQARADITKNGVINIGIQVRSNVGDAWSKDVAKAFAEVLASEWQFASCVVSQHAMT